MAVRKTDSIKSETSGIKTVPSNQSFFIEYNPYKNETVFLMNGEIAGGKFETYKKGYRLQQYLDANADWDGLLVEIKNRCNTSNVIHLEFKGREIDYNDIALSLEKNGMIDKFELTHTFAKNDNDMLLDIGELITGLDNTQIDELKEEKTKKVIQEAYTDAQDAKLRVSVIATMSSGKSTLINALLAKDILPSQNEACTATVARILDNDNMTTYKCVCKNRNEEEIEAKENVEKIDLERYNLMGKDMDNDDPNKIVFMDLNGPVPGISADKMTLLLQDTPGPNNSVDEKHKELTEEMIRSKKNSVILYIMNATQLRVEDDYKLLNIVSSAMRDGGKQARDRFIFVVNKFDEIDLEKEDAQKTIAGTKAYLAEFGIEQPNIFPVSARAALLLKMEHNGESLTRQELSDLNGYKFDFADRDFIPTHFEKIADVSMSVKEKLEKRLETADDYETALIHTGIPAIEESINEYLEKYAYPIKIFDAVVNLVSIVNGLDMTRKFRQKMAEDEETQHKLSDQVKNAKIKQNDAEKYKDEFLERINSFSINEDGETSPETLKKNISSEINNLQSEYDSESRVESSKAYKKLSLFERKIDSMQDAYASKLQSIIENDINDKGRAIASEYAELVRGLFEDIVIDGFDFSEIPEIAKYQLADIDTLIDGHSKTETEYEYYSVEVPNPKKHWFTPWRSKTIFEEHKRKIGETEYVDIQAIIVDECSKLEDDFCKNINTACDEGKAEIDKFKKVFSHNLSKLNDSVSEIIQEMEMNLNNIDKLKAELEQNSQKLKEIESLANKINDILNF